MTLVATSDVVLSLHNPKQLEDRGFSLNELIEKLLGLLAGGSQRNEILRLTGDTVVPVIECLNRVGEIWLGSRKPSP